MATTITLRSRAKDITISSVGTVEIATILNLVRQDKLEDWEEVIRRWPEPSVSNSIYLALTATASPFMSAQKVKNCFDYFSPLELAAAVTAAANAGDAVFTIVGTIAAS